MASDDPDAWWQHSPAAQEKNSPAGQWQQEQPAHGGHPEPGAPWGRSAASGPYPAPQQGAWEVPPLGAGGFGGPPPKNTGPLIAVLIAVVVLVLVGVVGLVALQSRGSAENSAAAMSTPASGSNSPSASAAATSTTATTSESPSAGTPVLREGLSPVAILGPTWQAGEQTYTMAFQGWPFAFRAPGSWGCMKGSIDRIPDAQAWGCVDESDPGAGQKINLILRKCPTTCDAAAQAAMNAVWFDNPAGAEHVDDRTAYVETASNEEGKFAVDFSRFFAAEPGGEPVWQVGVYLESPPATKDVVLKTLNDVATQTQ
ncbi:hypothetical protein [Nocardia sienata]|uniref:hypothetical protein n=1 Tax=Nocardia sienata TaxID=248552 RepID=UPI000AE7E9F5|nr:hypothetical protein [Nocardia sienata]